MWVYDPETLRFLRVNDAALARYGYSREEFLRLTLADIRTDTPTDDLAGLIADRRREMNQVCIRRHRLRDGRVLDVDVVSIELDDGSVLTIPRDVTDFMQAARRREALLEAERRARGEAERDRARFRALFEGSPGLFLVIEPPGYRIVEVSDAYLRATMTTRHEIVGRELFEVFPDDPAAPPASGVRNLRASLERVLERQRVDAMGLQRYPVPRPESMGGGFEERYWSVVNAPVLDDAGQVALIVHRVEDVTTYVRLLATRDEPFDPTTLDRPAVAMAAEVLTRADEIQQLNRRLEERDRLLAIAGRVARIGGWLVDLKTETVHWSDEVCALHDVPPGTTHSLTEAIDYYVPEYRPMISERFRECATAGSPYDLELELESAKGRRMWVRAIGEAVRDDEGRTVAVQGAFQDISAGKAAQAEVTRLANRLTRALDSMTDAFFTLDRDWRITYVNRQAEILLQHPHGELAGRRLWDAFPEARGSAFESAYVDAMQSGEVRSFEAYYPPLSAWFEVRAFPSSEGLAVYFRDFTAQHEAREKLVEQAALLDQARDAIIVKKLDGRITYCNRGAERLYGADAVGRLTDAMADELEYGPLLSADVKAHVLEHGEWIGELEQKRSDGTGITVQSHLTLVRDAAGRPSRILAINTDITDQKKLQGLMLRTQRLESIGTLAGGIAHDLNNVLTPIIMASSILMEDSTDPDTVDMLRTIQESADHGASLVRQVLAFARGVDGARVAIDIKRVTADVVRIMKETFPKNISLRTKLADDLSPLRGDPTQVHQVLLNLCVNARDAMPQGGTISISAENVEIDETYAALSPEATPGPHVRIAVDDTGTGIPGTIVERIFDPFFTTKPVGEGSGLGLSTVASIVRGFGGYVSVYSDPGRGSTFHVYLPAGTADTADPPTTEHVSEPADPQRGSGQLILVVDDEETVRTITRLTLTMYGYRVLTAIDGADALTIYARRGDEIDLVLTDMRMPVMDGPATVHALVRMDPTVRIIAASGLDSGFSDAPLQEGGVRRFLEKPYTAARLLAAVHHVLSERSP